MPGGCLHVVYSTCNSARKHYRAALVGSEWEKVRIEVSVLGNKNSRNFIMTLGCEDELEQNSSCGHASLGSEETKLDFNYPESGNRLATIWFSFRI